MFREVNVEGKYISFIILIVITIFCTIVAIPKVRVIEEYTEKAINPIDKTQVKIEELLDSIWSLAEAEQEEKESTVKSKSVIRTLMELSIFDNKVFTDIFIWVLITSVLYIILVYRAAMLTFKAMRNYESYIIVALLLMILILAVLFGGYFVGMFIIVICAIIAGVIALVTN